MRGYKTTRREFLRLLGCTPLALTLPLQTGCDAEQPRGSSTVALVKSGDTAVMLRRAVALAGGLDFIAPGDSVLLKVALNSPNPFPATTSPEVVAELTALLKEQGAGTVYVGDRSPVWQDTAECMQSTGISDAARSAGAEPVEFADADMLRVYPAAARYWPGGLTLPRLFTGVDHIIALPTLRTHALADFTMGIKIFVGALLQDDRYAMHRSLNFLKAIGEIPLFTGNIRLSLLDARLGFNRDGPDEGTLITPGSMIASRDLVAADAVGVALLQTTDTTPKLLATRVWDHPTIKRAVQAVSPHLSGDTLQLVTGGIANEAEIKDLLS